MILELVNHVLILEEMRLTAGPMKNVTSLMAPAEIGHQEHLHLVRAISPVVVQVLRMILTKP